MLLFKDVVNQRAFAGAKIALIFVSDQDHIRRERIQDENGPVTIVRGTFTGADSASSEGSRFGELSSDAAWRSTRRGGGSSEKSMIV